MLIAPPSPSLTPSASHGTIKFIQGCPCTTEPCAVAPGSGATITIGFIAGLSLLRA
jgi:hypothetical protein